MLTLYADHGRWGEAESDFREALTIAVQAYGQEDPHVADVMRDGASLMIDEGKLEPAAHVLRGAIAIYTHAGPEWNSQLAATYNLAGQDVGDSGDYKVAETLFQKAIDLSEKSDGPTSVAYGTYLGNLADVYQNEQRYAEAEPLFLRMIAILQQHYSLDNPILDEIDVNIALFYFGWDKPDRAAPWFDRYISSRLAQWKANAWTMSEQDRLVYYATLPGTFPIYFSFVTKYHDRYPALDREDVRRAAGRTRACRRERCFQPGENHGQRQSRSAHGAGQACRGKSPVCRTRLVVR